VVHLTHNTTQRREQMKSLLKANSNQNKTNINTTQRREQMKSLLKANSTKTRPKSTQHNQPTQPNPGKLYARNQVSFMLHSC
jgi:hypothetical protein